MRRLDFLLPAIALAGSALAADEPRIVPRAEWGALAAKPPWKGHLPTRITIHHAGVATNRTRTFFDKLRGLQAFSQRDDKLASGQSKPAWPDIPYHWYIGWEGQIAECRDPKIAGDTNTEYDPSGHLLICLEGSLGVEEPTGAQIRAVDAMVWHLVNKYNVRWQDIGAHMDFAKTDCPGKNFYPEIEKIRQRVRLRQACAGTLVP
jgi:hypothetical protein